AHQSARCGFCKLIAHAIRRESGAGTLLIPREGPNPARTSWHTTCERDQHAKASQSDGSRRHGSAVATRSPSTESGRHPSVRTRTDASAAVAAQSRSGSASEAGVAMRSHKGAGFKSVLCPIDFSEQSRLALQYAQAIATRSRARLTVLYVNDPLLAAAAAALRDRQLQAQAERELRTFIDASMTSTSRRRCRVKSSVL